MYTNSRSVFLLYLLCFSFLFSESFHTQPYIHIVSFENSTFTMITATLSILSPAALGAAQSSVVSLFLNAEPVDLVGSIADSVRNTYKPILSYVPHG